MATPNGMTTRPPPTSGTLEHFTRLIPAEMRAQPQEVQMAYISRLVQQAGGVSQLLALAAQRNNANNNSQGFPTHPNGQQMRPGSPNLNFGNMPLGANGLPVHPNSPGMAQRMRPTSVPTQQGIQQPMNHVPLTLQTPLRPPLSLQQQSPTNPLQGQQPASMATQTTPAPRQMNLAQAQTQFLQDQSRFAQTTIAAMMNGAQQTPRPRPPGILSSQAIQRSPSGSMSGNSSMSPVHPLQAQAQAMQHMSQAQMQGNGPGPGMTRPPLMRNQASGPINGGGGIGMGNGGQVHTQAPLSGNQPAGGPTMANVGPRKLMMGAPASGGPIGAGQAGQAGIGVGGDPKVRMMQIIKDPQKLQTWMKVFDGLAYYQKQKEANQLTPEESQALDGVLAIGPEFFARIRAQSLHLGQSQSGGQNSQHQNQTPFHPGQHRGPLVAPNQMQQSHQQLQQQQQGPGQNFQRPPSSNINGQASVMANRTAMSQQGLPQMAQSTGGNNTQGLTMMNQQQLNSVQPPTAAQSASPSINRAGVVSSAQSLPTAESFEVMFNRMNELPAAKRGEHLQQSKIRITYFNHIRYKMTPEAQKALYERLPDVAQLYQAHVREQDLVQAQARLAAHQASLLSGAGSINAPQSLNGNISVAAAQQSGSNAMNQAITANPLPNLQMPVGRQRASLSGPGQQGGSSQTATQSPSFAAAGLQVAQGMSSPGGSVQGTPSFRAAALATMQRSGTPSRMNPLAQRGSPTVSHASSPRIPDNDAIAAVHAAAQSSVSDLAAGSQHYATGQRMQIPMPGQIPAGMGSISNMRGVPGHMPAMANLRNGNVSGDGRTPLQPLGQPVENINTISETVSDSARRPPSPKPFPGTQAQRPTLTSGLAGTGLVVYTPVLSQRPGSFDRIATDLAAAMGKPGMAAKPSRGALFERPNALSQEEGDVAEGDDAVAIPSDSVEEVEMRMEDALLEEPVTIVNESKRKFTDIAAGVQKNLTITEGVAEFMRELADEFIDSVVDAGSRLAKHRRFDRLEVKDVQYHLEMEYGMHIPGFESDTLRIEQVKSKLELTKARGGNNEGAASAPTHVKGPATSHSTRAGRFAAMQQAKQAAASALKAEVGISA